MEGETRERVVQGRPVVGCLECVMERKVNIEATKELYDGVIVALLVHRSEVWVVWS